MFRALRNAWRLLRMAVSFARHDALFPLETLGIAPGGRNEIMSSSFIRGHKHIDLVCTPAA